MVQLSPLLALIAAHADGRRSPEEIAARIGTKSGRRLTGADVRYLISRRLAPTGIVAGAAAAEGGPESTPIRPREGLFALRFRTPVVPQGAVDALARLLQPLFLPPVVLASLIGLVAMDIWLFGIRGLGAGLSELVAQPALVLVVSGLAALSLAFHECGHAAACRYGGARPGRIGVGIYLIWPAFYTELTDAYRLGRAGRLRTDLGGIYFTALFALLVGVAYLLTGHEILIPLALILQLEAVDEFMPWLRLDGYYVVADLAGVPDLFARVGPVLRSLRPGAPRDPRVEELTPRARAIVIGWVLTAVPVLAALLTLLAIQAPTVVREAAAAVRWRGQEALAALDAGDPAAAAAELVQVGLLLAPAVGLTLMSILLTWRLGAALGRRARPADAAGKAPHGGECAESSDFEVPEAKARARGR